MAITWTTWQGQDVILTEGGYVDDCGKIAGMFTSEEDARAGNADELAIGILAWDRLSDEQQQDASANSDALCD